MKNVSNAELARILRNVAAAYAIKNETKYKFQIIAYNRAADAIEGSTTEVKELFKEGKLQSIPGVGKSLCQHIEELFKTGTSKNFEWATSGIPKAVFALLDVPTFGPKKAFRLTTEFNLNDPATVVKDIEELAKKGKIAPLDGFGEKSQEDILQAITEYRQGVKKNVRMVLPYAGELSEKILDYMKHCPEVLEINTLGSMRRMVSTIGDIDLAAATQEPKKVIDYFIQFPSTARVIEKGVSGASILLSSGRHVDLLTQPKQSYGSLLQHFTGSKHHNVALREYALKKGLSLSEYGIKNQENKKLETFDTEEKFYKRLGMDWIPPEIREDSGEIELALTHKLPKLVELNDIKGDLHIHSNYPIEPSHDLGQSTMEEMIQKAIDFGYEYIGFSEHNPSVSKHTAGQMYTILAKRKEKIQALEEKFKSIRIISLMETDILVDGKLALDEKCLSLLDGTLVSIHSSFNMSKESMTKRVLTGLAHKKAKILSHPTGRLLNQRAGYDLDFEAVFDYCKKFNKALEINAWPQRLDLPDIIVHEAVKKGIALVIDTDSHEVSHMNLMRYGVSVARRGWAEKKNIINTLSYKNFLEWLKS